MLGNVLSLKDEDDLSVDEDEQVSPCNNNRCSPKPVNVSRAVYVSRNINTETFANESIFLKLTLFWRSRKDRDVVQVPVYVFCSLIFVESLQYIIWNLDYSAW